jgi:hypothetical protein
MNQQNRLNWKLLPTHFADAIGLTHALAWADAAAAAL